MKAKDLSAALRRAATLVVVMAMLLPGVLSLLPSPATAEEQALYRDLQVSRCLDKEDGSLPMSGMAHGECCILCQPTPVAARPDEPAKLIVFAPVRPAFLVSQVWERDRFLPDPTHWLPLSRRGPPA